MKNNKLKLVLKIVCAVLCAAIVMAGSVGIAAYVMQDDIDALQAKLDLQELFKIGAFIPILQMMEILRR